VQVLNPFASISWPQPNAFGITQRGQGAAAATAIVQYVTLSTNVSYDANVPWTIKAQSLNSGKLVNPLGTAAEEITYKFALGVGSSTGGVTTGVAASDGL
jgi:hypothetical protein